GGRGWGLTSGVMSGCGENATMSAGWPAATARLWSPEAPYDWVNLTFFPAGVAWNAAMIFWYAACGVEYATRASVTVPAPPEAVPAHAVSPAAATLATATAVRARSLREVPAVREIAIGSLSLLSRLK